MSRISKLSLALLALAVLLLASPAQAQVLAPAAGFGPYGAGPLGYAPYTYNPYGFGYGYGGLLGGGTAAGNYLWGQSQLVQAQGQYLYDSSQAAINYQTAYTKELENESNYVRTYFEKQKMNRDYVAMTRTPPATREQLVRWAKAAAPGRPDSAEFDQPSGIIMWPDALMASQFDDLRAAMEKLYGERTGTNFGIASPLYGDIQRVAGVMKAELKEQVHVMDPAEYLAARKLIERLAYEARFAPALPGVAAK